MNRAAAQIMEDALWDATRRVLGESSFDGGALTAAVIARSRRYTSERELLAQPLTGRALTSDLAARALFFTPADAGKLSIPLAELARANLVPAGRIHLLDLGAGCGAMAFAVLALAAERGTGLTVCAIDRDDGALVILATALAAAAHSLGVPLDLAVRREAVAAAALEPDAFDLVTAGSLFNELPEEGAHLPLATRMLAAARPDGAAIIVEPALRETARALHRVRDGLIDRGAHIFAPCTRQVAPCPMLRDERDWCHEERPPALPERAGRLAVELGLRDSGMKFAYLVARRAPASQMAVSPGSQALRVVSHPFRAKGKVECFGCGELGRVRLRLLRRHRTTENRGFERARRGDVVVMDEGAAASGEVATETVVALHALPRNSC